VPGAATTSAEYLALPADDVGGRLGRWTSYALAVSATALIVAVVFAGDARHRGLVALARVAIAGVPVAVGLYARSRRHGDRFGLLLIALGATSAVTVLAESSDEGLYTAGRIAGWLFVALLVHVILACPTGRLEGRADRALVAAIALVVAVL
jgi:hypothetical protein